MKDIDEFVSKCPICLKEGGKKIQTKNKIFRTERPNQLWEIDLIGRIEDHNKENHYIFVAIDHFTKWVETKVIKNKNGKTVADLIEKLIIEKHGIPEEILTDNGKEFMNMYAEEIKNKYKFTWSYNSPGHHKTLGAVERVNQTLFKKIRKLSNFGEKDWKRVVEKATFAYNISFNRSILSSPKMLKYGLIPDFPVDFKYCLINKSIPIQDLITKRNSKFENYAKINIQKGKILNKEIFEAGDRVLVYKDVLGHKIKSRWEMGYLIKRRHDQDSYIVEKNGREYRLNKAQLKRDKSDEGRCRS